LRGNAVRNVENGKDLPDVSRRRPLARDSRRMEKHQVGILPWYNHDEGLSQHVFFARRLPLGVLDAHQLSEERHMVDVDVERAAYFFSETQTLQRKPVRRSVSSR